MPSRTGIRYPALHGIVSLDEIGQVEVLSPLEREERVFFTHGLVTISRTRPRGRVCLGVGVGGGAPIERIAEWRDEGSYPMDFGPHGLPLPPDKPLVLEVSGARCSAFCAAVGYSALR